MNVMKRAWEIARAAVEEFGGKVREYFGQSLKQAWAEKKGTFKAVAKKVVDKVVEVVVEEEAPKMSRIEKVRAEYRAAKQALEDFRAKHGIVFTPTSQALYNKMDDLKRTLKYLVYREKMGN